MILAGDIGGTKTLIAAFLAQGSSLVIRAEQIFRSADHASLEEIVAAFAAAHPGLHFEVACFGVAGAIVDGACHLTNLPWNLSEQALSRALGIPRVKLLNDLEASAVAMPYLAPEELCVLNQGTRRPGNVAVVAAGTGLGEAMLFWDGAAYRSMASEGGHADFAPRNEQQAGLMRYLREKFEAHVSYERALSGPGIFNIYSFLRDSGFAPEPAWLRDELAAAADKSAEVTRVGLAHKSPLCEATLSLFAAIYGAEAGNLALKCLAYGGVYIAGGIAPKILPVMREGQFIANFMQKGRLEPLMRSLPVQICLNLRSALMGAARTGMAMIASA